MEFQVLVSYGSATFIYVFLPAAAVLGYQDESCVAHPLKQSTPTNMAFSVRYATTGTEFLL